MEDLRSDTLLASTTEVKGYKILPPCVLYARIGAGGMGAVYRGHHLNLDIDVAVKCLKPTLVADDPTFVDRFKREGRSAAKINHQNVIRVFDVAEHMGLHYLIMEFVSGETARQRVERKGTLQLGEALQIVYESSLGLGEAHRMGIIHRDVKPDNLLISSRGQVKVADLGLAKPAVSSGQSMLSMAGQVMGTPPYMPPEQWGEGTVTAASDVWAMGAVLYYLLTGREAMSGESLAAIMSKIVLHDFPDVREFRPDVPDSVMAVLQKATSRAPGERYLDAYELAEAIGQLPEHRISLADNDAGTTELRTMLSPPPNASLNEIKKVLATKTPTVREDAPGLDPEPEPEPQPTGGGFPWAIVLVLLILGGGGGAGYYYKDVLFGTKPTPVNPDLLATVKSLRSEGKFVAALVEARDVFANNPDVVDEALATELRTASEAQLRPCLTQDAPTAPVKKGAEVTFKGRFEGIAVKELLIGDTVATLQGGTFTATLTPPEDGKLTVRARLTDEDTVDFAEWQVTFEEEKVKPIAPTVAPAAFVGALQIEPRLGDSNSTDKSSVIVVGKANDKDLVVRLQGKVLDNIQWEDDGTFRATVDLSKEGRNPIKLTIARPDATGSATSEQTQSIEVVRLMEQPTLTLVTPLQATSSTKAAEVILEVTTDEWTKSVTAKAGDQTITFAKAGDKNGKTTWRAETPLQLADDKNTAEIVATNLTNKVRKQALTVTCTAPPIEITDITLAVGIKDFDVLAGKTYFVDRQPTIEAKLSDADAKLVRNDTESPTTFRAAAPENQSKVYELRAKKGLRESKPFTFTIVRDTLKPVVKAARPADTAPNSKVTLSGTWSDNFAIDSIRTATGQTAKLMTKTPTSGTWSLDVRVGKTAKSFMLTATDKAGNKSTTPVKVDIIQPKPIAKPTPQPVKPQPVKPVVLTPQPQPAVKLSTKINQAQFEPIGKLNKKGFPRELRHKTTGIELVAINFVDTMAPSVYVSKRVVTEKQWDDNGGSEPKVEITHKNAYDKLQEPRFAGLAMVTKQQWSMVTTTSTKGLIRNEKAEWLAYDPSDSRTMRAAWTGEEVRMMKHTDSNKYIGFRVSFTPK